MLLQNVYLKRSVKGLYQNWAIMAVEYVGGLMARYSSSCAQLIALYHGLSKSLFFGSLLSVNCHVLYEHDM